MKRCRKGRVCLTANANSLALRLLLDCTTNKNFSCSSFSLFFCVSTGGVRAQQEATHPDYFIHPQDAVQYDTFVALPQRPSFLCGSPQVKYCTPLHRTVLCLGGMSCTVRAAYMFSQHNGRNVAIYTIRSICMFRQEPLASAFMSNK